MDSYLRPTWDLGISEHIQNDPLCLAHNSTIKMNGQFWTGCAGITGECRKIVFCCFLCSKCTPISGPLKIKVFQSIFKMTPYVWETTQQSRWIANSELAVRELRGNPKGTLLAQRGNKYPDFAPLLMCFNSRGERWWKWTLRQLRIHQYICWHPSDQPSWSYK